MIIGSISENKNLEKRISITPEISKKYISSGFTVKIEKGIAEHIGIKDEEYKNKKSFLFNSNDSLMICKNENRLICFFKIENNFVKPTRVFNL